MRLIGCLHLAPSWIFEAHDSILAVDIGGTNNFACGVVEPAGKKAARSVEGRSLGSRSLAPRRRRADAQRAR